MGHFEVMPNNHAIIHIGLERCGSTSIQNFFELNKQQFERYGIYKSRQTPSTVHSRLGLLGLDPQDTNEIVRQEVGRDERVSSVANQLFDELKREVGSVNNRKFFFTSELLSSQLLSEHQILKLHNSLTEIFSSILFVLVVRRQEVLISSRYSEYVKSGGASSFVEYCGQDEVVGSESTNVVKIVRRWTSSVPNSQLLVVPYFEDEDGASFLRRFFRTVGFETITEEFGFGDSVSANRRLSQVTLDALLEIRRCQLHLTPAMWGALVKYAIYRDQVVNSHGNGSHCNMSGDRFVGSNQEVARFLKESEVDRFMKSERLPLKSSNSENKPNDPRTSIADELRRFIARLNFE